MVFPLFLGLYLSKQRDNFNIMTLPRYIMAFLGMVMLTLAVSKPTQAQSAQLGDYSVFRSPIPGPYVLDPRIGSIRPNEERWSAPIYRVPSNQNPPLVTVTNGWRTEQWPIPTSAIPAAGADAHLAVVYEHNNIVYEAWSARWENATTLRVGAFTAYPLNGSGVSASLPSRTTASGFAVTAGMITREDFTNPSTGNLDPNMRINHALSMALNFDLVAGNYYVNPAGWGEELGRLGVEGVPMGRRYALPPTLNVDSLSVHPFSREILRALRDYGVFVNDTNATPQLPDDSYVGTVRVEPGLTNDLYGIDNDTLRITIGNDIQAVIAAHGLYNVNPNEVYRWSGFVEQPPVVDAMPSQELENFGDFTAFIPEDSSNTGTVSQAPTTTTNSNNGNRGNTESVTVNEDGSIDTTFRDNNGAVTVVRVQPNGGIVTTVTNPDGTVTVSEAPPLQDIDATSTPSILADIAPQLRGQVFGRVIAENSRFYRSNAEVGIQWVLDRGVIHAVDVFSPAGTSAAGIQLCMKGYGTIHFMDAANAPRTAVPLVSRFRAGYTCATLPGLGTVTLTR